MKGAIRRVIRSQGVEFDVRNASSSSGDRTTPSYADDGTVMGVTKTSTGPTVETTSAGEEINVDLEIRAIIDGTTTIVDAGTTENPTKLIHPDGYEYQVLAVYPEDNNVAVMTVTRV